MFHFVHDWFFWPEGSILVNLVSSALWVAPTAYMFIWHHKCRECLRPGQVPVTGTVHKVCKKHAREQGHTHS